MKQSGSNGEEHDEDMYIEEYPQLWNLNIEEVVGHNLESSGREEVNKLLKEGWILLYIYTLLYKDESEEGVVWRQRPMAILGRPASPMRD